MEEVFDFVTQVERDLQTPICLLEQQAGISTENRCKISGDYNKCPAGSTMEYAGDQSSLDAFIQCPLDSVAQSEWIEASQKGLCSCSSSRYDENCDLVQKDMDCECFACPFGLTLGFAYSCNTEIVGPCKSFDCFGRCNGKYDPGNLVGDKETFPPTRFDEKDVEASANRNDLASNQLMGTALLTLALFRMVF